MKGRKMHPKCQQGMTFSYEDIPSNLIEEAEKWRVNLIEAAVENARKNVKLNSFTIF